MATPISAAIAPDSPVTAPAEEAFADSFAELEARIQRVAAALRQARAERDSALSERDQARAALEQTRTTAATEATALRAAHEKLQHAHTLAERELVGLRKERNDVRQRVGKLVAQLETALP